MKQRKTATRRQVKKETAGSSFSILFQWFPAIIAMLLLNGCSDVVLFTPMGPIGESERHIILTAFLLMLIVVLPVIVLALWFARRYKVSNRPDHGYDPKWSYSHKIELAIWLIPLAIVTALGSLIWNNTSRLDPFTPIESHEKPVNIDVVSLDWKWLFIYPDEHVAVVNQLVFPVNAPLSFRVTSGSVMTSFFIPQLGSQIYAMAGMQTRLHLLAHTEGTYLGQNQQFSGTGYADMNFPAIATSPEGYSAWLKKLRKSPQALDMNGFKELAKPTSGYPVTYFSQVDPELFDRIVQTFAPHGGKHWPQESEEPPGRRIGPEAVGEPREMYVKDNFQK